jgi:hypothetical protein
MIVLDEIGASVWSNSVDSQSRGERGWGGAEMGQQQYGRRLEPSWPTVAATTFRLWLQRRNEAGRRLASRRRRGVLVLSAIAAVALGAVVTLAFTEHGTQSATQPGAPYRRVSWRSPRRTGSRRRPGSRVRYSPAATSNVTP